ncbi:glycosyltransferase family 9 protein [Rhodospirillaceae bacterium KN72]|uniref:Glycosyltransferase family 9 protein n=1 Tax=Pacificispira spongiicola TaxID=2729598 RepID=A0A7Y0E3N1_9PROT|nr:glycosyltransferase family 9 protein [Pacificispira spongiicola]NMM45856.1 glycosyltransferase family 9 protein [Pacificispira spongiicola]
MRLLFITSNRIGDAVLSTGLLAHLIAQNPGIRVTVAAGPASAPLFGGVPGLERVIIVRKQRFSLHWWKLWRAVSGTRWDIAVDLRRSAILTFLRAGRKLVVPKPQGVVHRLDLLGSMVGRSDDPPLPTLWWNVPHEQQAEKLLSDGDGPVLAVGPTANWQGKVWPAENFVEIIARLTAADGPLPGARVAVFGGPDERLQANPVIAAIPRNRRIDVVGKIDLLTAAALLSRVQLYIGNDSGLMHMAAAVRVPVLGLFGPSKDDLYAPRGPKARALRTPESMEELIGFDGYDRHTVGSLMTSLTVDRVVEAATEMLR